MNDEKLQMIIDTSHRLKNSLTLLRISWRATISSKAL